jgi:hypothetical protein
MMKNKEIELEKLKQQNAVLLEALKQIQWANYHRGSELQDVGHWHRFIKETVDPLLPPHRSWCEFCQKLIADGTLLKGIDY